MEERPEAIRAKILEGATNLLAYGILTTRDIAAALTKAGLVGVDKRLVNSVLTTLGKGRFSYDRTTYIYALSSPDAPIVPAPTTHTDSATAPTLMQC
jgi:hypothetical protein